jgi:hypothetical protein
VSHFREAAVALSELLTGVQITPALLVWARYLGGPARYPRD